MDVAGKTLHSWVQSLTIDTFSNEKHPRTFQTLPLSSEIQLLQAAGELMGLPKLSLTQKKIMEQSAVRVKNSDNSVVYRE
ncbi:hypothetical protein RvY_17748 [Ramazzottius varieornatus]|uniref:Uncharacterized protein n=1 Tax=Ramazzottius varieornatus TaxID=947166 RepID=A0A1D1W9Y4_RAMVA|nr:hypothetical protein RvY_17748 [Ramazzottius varieornatus]